MGPGLMGLPGQDCKARPGLMRALLLAAAVAVVADTTENAPPVYGAYPTGGPVHGGTTITIVGKEFGRINTVGLNRVRCSWGDPRPWQQAVFATQQSEMDGWSAHEAELAAVPPVYFTQATQLLAEVPVTPLLRATFGLPADVTEVDLLECPSHEHVAADVSLWFSLRFYTIEAANATADRYEPNLMDTGFTYMYYPAPENFTNAAITGGPVAGGTLVVIDGTGFTGGFRNASDIDLSNLIMRCRFTDKPSVISFLVGSAEHGCDADPLTGTLALSVVFDMPTNGLQLARAKGNGFAQPLRQAEVDELFTFASTNGGAVHLADRYTAEWVDARQLVLLATNPPVASDSEDDEAVHQLLRGGSGLTLSVRTGQMQLRRQGSVAPWLDGSAPVATTGVPLDRCLSSNETSSLVEVVPQVSFVSPIALTPTRVVCLSPARSTPVVSDLDVALNGQDYHSNGLAYAYYLQPAELTHLTPVTAGPMLGGSVVTVHGRGLAAFSKWGASASNARCRWHGMELTVPTYLDDTRLVCQTAAQPFAVPTEVLLEISLNDRDFIAVTPDTTLRFMYYVQPQAIKAISPTGGRLDGGTLVTIDGGGFEAYPGINVSDVRVGWGDTDSANQTTPLVLGDSRIIVAAYPSDDPAPRQLYLSLNVLNSLPINASFLYYEQPSNFTACEPTGGPTRGGTAVTIHGGPFDLFSTDVANTLCRFGTSYVPAMAFERYEIVCLTPAAAQPGTVPVAISLNGAETDFGPIERSFKYYQQPRPKGNGGVEDLTQLTPVGGPLGGGTRVTIYGSGFTAFSSLMEYVLCRWQATIVDQNAAAAAGTLLLPPPESGAVEHTDTMIVCLAPRARAGANVLVNLTLSLNAHDFGDTGLTFQYYELPYVAAITPSGGHRTGGTMVTILGTGFDVLEDGAHVSCQYGSPYNLAYNARFTITQPVSVTSEAIVCAAPSTKVTDTRQLWVALNGIELSTGRDPRPTGQNYTYYNPPTVFSVLPQAGVFSGGTVVTLLGQGFHGLAGNTQLASCRFVTSNSVSDTKPIELLPELWTCRSPNQTGIAEGEAALVLVTLNAQQYVDTTYRFLYYGLRIDRVTVNGGPPGGVTTGSTVVTLQGYGFDSGPVAFCRFGGADRQPVAVLEVTRELLLCATPPATSAGDVHLLLSNDDVVYIDTGLDYTYYVQPTSFSSVSPGGGPKRGGTKVTLRGSGFSAFVSESQPLSPDEKMHAARCLWGGEFSSTLSIDGWLRNTPRTSPLAQGGLQMSGKAGVTAPDISAAVLADPDNAGLWTF